MAFHFWGIQEEDENPAIPDPHEFAPDWAWFEWVSEQGIGE